MTKHDGEYHFVPHATAKQWEALGWEYSYDHTIASSYGSYYKWAGEGEPVYPQRSLLEKDEIERQMRERAKELRDFDEIFGIGGDGE